jgi:hypothetical protein
MFMHNGARRCRNAARPRIDSTPGSGTRIDVEIPTLQPLQSRSDSNERPD